jgi:hypothetical protein
MLTPDVLNLFYQLLAGVRVEPLSPDAENLVALIRRAKEQLESLATTNGRHVEEVDIAGDNRGGDPS